MGVKNMELMSFALGYMVCWVFFVISYLFYQIYVSNKLKLVDDKFRHDYNFFNSLSINELYWFRHKKDD